MSKHTPGREREAAMSFAVSKAWEACERGQVYADAVVARNPLRPVLDWRDRKYHVLRNYVGHEISLEFTAITGRRMPAGTFDTENARRLAVEILRACDDIDDNAAAIAMAYGGGCHPAGDTAPTTAE